MRLTFSSDLEEAMLETGKSLSQNSKISSVLEKYTWLYIHLYVLRILWEYIWVECHWLSAPVYWSAVSSICLASLHYSMIKLFHCLVAWIIYSILQIIQLLFGMILAHFVLVYVRIGALLCSATFYNGYHAFCLNIIMIRYCGNHKYSLIRSYMKMSCSFSSCWPDFAYILIIEPVLCFIKSYSLG